MPAPTVDIKECDMSLATQVLKYSSTRAVELWNLLKQTKDESELEILTTSFLQHKSDQEVAIDAVAEVAEQIEAEIAAITARKQYLVDLHNRAIDKLKSKQETIDKTIIQRSLKVNKPLLITTTV